MAGIACCTEFLFGVLILVLWLAEDQKCYDRHNIAIIITWVWKLVVLQVLYAARICAAVSKCLMPNALRLIDLCVNIISMSWGFYCMYVFFDTSEVCKEASELHWVALLLIVIDNIQSVLVLDHSVLHHHHLLLLHCSGRSCHHSSSWQRGQQQSAKTRPCSIQRKSKLTSG